MRAHFCSTVRNNNDLAFTGFAQPFQIADAVAQVSVQTGNFGVEFGGAGGGVFKQSMPRKKEQSETPKEADVNQPDSLSIHRSFLLRLYPGSDLDTAEISGRVEHVVSGEAKEFRCVSDLLNSLGQLLRRVDP